MLKNAIRYTSYMLVLFGFSAVGTACGDDDDKKKDLCYKCTYDGDTQTICYEDYKDEYTEEEFEEYISIIEDYLDIDCTKQ